MNIVTQNPTPSDTQDVKRLKREARAACNTAVRFAERIKKLADEVGKTQLETDLGGDSAELTDAYNAIKTLVATLDPSAVVPDLE